MSNEVKKPVHPRAALVEELTRPAGWPCPLGPLQMAVHDLGHISREVRATPIISLFFTQSCQPCATGCFIANIDISEC